MTSGLPNEDMSREIPNQPAQLERAKSKEDETRQDRAEGERDHGGGNDASRLWMSVDIPAPEVLKRPGK